MYVCTGDGAVSCFAGGILTLYLVCLHTLTSVVS